MNLSPPSSLLLAPMVLLCCSLLGGCAASYVRYDVSGTGTAGCPPAVVADAGLGVSVTVRSDAVVCDAP